MNYIIVDLEWNVQSNPDNYYKYNSKIKNFHEIIEIGAVKLNSKLEYLDSFRIYIQPRIYKKMNVRINKLTGISMKDLEFGFEFTKAFKLFKQWAGDDFLLCTWGENDIDVFKKNIDYHIPNYDSRPLLLPRMDIQRYCCDILDYDRQVSLQDMMNFVNIVPTTDRDHQALNDTINSARVFKELIDEEKIQPYINNSFKILRHYINIDLSMDMLDQSKLQPSCVCCEKPTKQVELSFDDVKNRVEMISYCSSCNIYTIEKVKVKVNRLNKFIYLSNKRVLEVEEDQVALEVN